MNYLNVKERFSSEHNITYTDATRDWFLDSDDEKIYLWTCLSLVRFFDDSDVLPFYDIDLIELENYKGERFNYDLIMPDGRLIDFFTVGIQYFVSARLKDIFEFFYAEACFSEAIVNIDGVVYPEKYYLLSPMDMLVAFDEDNSTYTKKLNLLGEEVVDKVENYFLDYDCIPFGQKLFELRVKGKRSPLIICDKVAEKVVEENITGIDFVKVEGM